MIKVQDKPSDFSQHRNATWQETFDQIVGYGQQGLSTAQDLKDQFTGDKPIDSGNLGGGAGTYEITSGVNRDESKIMGLPTPLFWGILVVAGIGAAYFFASTKKTVKK